MKRSKFTEEQIAYALREVAGGTAVGDVCRQLGVSETTFYIWISQRAVKDDGESACLAPR